jgi:hypothetical protein
MGGANTPTKKSGGASIFRSKVKMTARSAAGSSIMGESPDTLRTQARHTMRGAESTRRSSFRKTGPEAPAALTAYDVWTWGFGGRGALGNRAFRDELAPYLVSELRGHGGTLLVACGLDHTIAVTAYQAKASRDRLTLRGAIWQVTGDMRARGWGRSQEGQLGAEKSDELETPRGTRAVLAPTLLGICRGEAGASVQACRCAAVV